MDIFLPLGENMYYSNGVFNLIYEYLFNGCHQKRHPTRLCMRYKDAQDCFTLSICKSMQQLEVQYFNLQIYSQYQYISMKRIKDYLQVFNYINQPLSFTLFFKVNFLITYVLVSFIKDPYVNTLTVGEPSTHRLFKEKHIIGRRTWTSNGTVVFYFQHCPDGVSYSKVAVTIASFQIVYIFRFLHISVEAEKCRCSPPLVSMGDLFQEPPQITKFVMLKFLI